MTDLVEQVARAMCEADCGQITENELARCRDFARAIIPVVREDCAKVAEAEKVNAAETDDESDRAYNRACDHIAAALREGQ
jgi:hypothetical protein